MYLLGWSKNHEVFYPPLKALNYKKVTVGKTENL